MLSLPHLILILLTIVSVYLITNHYSKADDQQVHKLMKVIAITILFFDPAYWIWEYMTYGSFNWATTFPFYLCSLFWILMPFATFLKPSNLKQIALSNIATIGLISGILGFVLNYHIDVHGIVSFVGIRTLLYHYLMILTSVLIWRTKYYQPQPGDQIRAMIPVLLILIPGIILNLLYGYDYGYTAGGQGTPLTIISSVLPKPIFLFMLYLSLFGLVWFIFYRKLPISTEK